MSEKGKGELTKAFAAFMGFVILYAALGVPAYLYYRKTRAGEIGAERARAENPERKRHDEPEALVRPSSVPPAGIRDPDPRPRDAAPKDVYDYLPAEQRKMLRLR